MLDQMQAEKDLGKRIRGMQREKRDKHRKHQRCESARQRVIFSENPNDPSGSEQDVNMNKRKVHSDGESQPDQGSKRSRSERSGAVKAYDPPSNKEVRKHQSQYETG